MFQKYKNKENDLDKDDNSTQQLPTEQTEIYATSFSLNIPDNIEILVNTKVKLNSGYINITPTNFINKVTYEISASQINAIK